MLLALHRSLVKPLEPSSCAPARLGPKALMPAAVRSSTMPAQSGASGPTTTRSIFCALQKAITAAWSAMSSATTSQSLAMPALPGAQKSRATSGLAAIFQASACSRPPEPRRRMFMRVPPEPWFSAGGVAWLACIARRRSRDRSSTVHRSVLGPRAANVRAAWRKRRYGYQTVGLHALAPPACGLFHRHGVAGPDHRGAGAGAHQGRLRALRTAGAHRMAYPSARPDLARHVRRGSGCALGRPGAGDPSRRHGLDRTGGKALARRRSRYGDGAHRAARGLDGTHVTWLEKVSD